MMYVKEFSKIIFLSILTLYLMVLGNAAATVVSVNNGTGQEANFTSIQDAITAANPGDLIVVKPGVYEENIVVDKNVSIISESGNFSDTIVQAADSSQDTFSIMANGINIKGFGISGSNSAGIHLLGVSECHIENNRLFNNNCGIDLYIMSSGNRLENNEISDSPTGISLGGSLYNNLSNNFVLNCSNGISLFDSPNNFLENNTISENIEGISLTGESNDNTLRNNSVIFNKELGLHIYETSNNWIYNNQFNNTVNVKSEAVSDTNFWNITKTRGTNIAGGPYVGGNLWEKPDGTIYPEGVKDVDFDGILDSQYNIEGSQLIDYLPLKESKSSTITVNNSTGKAADFTSIQSAIDNASPGDTIFIFPGIYEENINVYVPNLTLTSESASNGDTIVKAANSQDDVFYVNVDKVTIRGLNIKGPIDYPYAGIHLNGVKYCNIENNQLSNNDNDTIFDIFTGNSSFAINNSNSDVGLGIRLDSSSSNILSNNTVTGNGISILLRNSAENTLINNSALNSKYGIWMDSSNSNMLNENNLSNNKIGAYLKISSGNTLNDSTVSNNTGSGINLWDSAENILSNSTASKNNISIVLRNSSANVLNNNKISDSDYGLWLYSSSNDNQLNGNTALNNRVGIYVKTSSGNVLTGNTALNSSGSGIHVWNSIENTLINNVASNNYVSVFLQNSSKNTFFNNTVSGSSYGMWVALSSNNNLSNNDALNNKFGIYLKNSSDNRLSGNQANSNLRYGIYLGFSSGNFLNSNRILSNSEYGLFLLNSRNSSIYNNYFNNTRNIYLEGSNAVTSLNTTLKETKNIVDGPFLGGNFWATPKKDGFSQTHADENGNGICDVAYVVNKEGIDYLPLADFNTTNNKSLVIQK